MFEKTRYQLTVAYIGVLTVILTIFTLSVRYTFARSLNQQFDVKLNDLAKAAAFNMDNEDGELEVDDEETLVGSEQTIEWFDLEEELLYQQGKYDLEFPLDLENSWQTYNLPVPLRSFTRPVNDLEYEEQIIGYVRVSD